MTSQSETAATAGKDRGGPLGWLGHQIAHHPRRPILLWVAILAICLLPAANVGSVITNNFANPLPSTDQSVVAQNAYNQQFPHAASSPSSSILLLEAPNIVGPVGRNATLALTDALAADRQLRNVSSVDSLYSAYASYLTGQVELGWSFLGPALSASPSLPTAVNGTATLLWAPIGTYYANWNATVHTFPAGTPPSAADLPAFNATAPLFASNATETAILGYFYNGTVNAPGFNASIYHGCLSTETALACADTAARANLGPIIATFPVFPAGAALFTAQVTLAGLGVGNWSQALPRQAVASTVLGDEVGLPPSWVLTIWQAFPSGSPPTAVEAAAWTQGIVRTAPLDQLPLPIPTAILHGFVSQSGSAELVMVSFNVDDSYSANGSLVNFADVTEIDHVASTVLSSPSPYSSIKYYQTGSAPLDSATSYLATSSLSLLLVLTVVVLLVIMLLYFRALAAPALAFGMIGLALVASFALIFVAGRLVTTFNSEIESIILVFLMSIGTDYSVFLLARYREELVRGTNPKEAVAITVRWAGQSITTSGLAVMVVAIALTVSGISFLSQLGLTLLIAVACALVANLTVLPSILVLVGPRIFWPNSGARFQRYAERRTRSIETHRDSIARAGRAATRRPILVIGVILILSVPVVAVALQVPVSYDITNIGLPASNPAQAGFVQLQNDFGASYSSTSFALVTFTQPIVVGGQPNGTLLREIVGVQAAMNATPGVASVTTFVGPGGAPLDAWLNFSYLPPATQISLNRSLGSSIGADGETVLFTIATNASGYSASAISVLDALQQHIDQYRAAHPGIAQVYLGGAAPTTQDIRSLVNQATEEMLIGAAIGLLLLMLVLLGSAFVPLLALGVIGLSILWSWAATYFVVGILENEALIFLLPLILLILVLGLGMDYNVLLLTRVKEERSLGDRGAQAIRDAVTHAGGVITAAAIILGGAFLLLGFTSPLGLLAAIGLGIGFAVLLQAFVVQLFFTPAVLTLGKDAIWKGLRRSK